jgi:homoaconitase/3-isopropylmalate dehydratase large subunit
MLKYFKIIIRIVNMRKCILTARITIIKRDGKVVTKGYGNIASSVMENENITIGAKSLYAYLISKTGASESCYPSNATIMKSLGIKSRMTLSDYKIELVASGLLKVEERTFKSGRLTSNNYYPTKLILDRDEE